MKRRFIVTTAITACLALCAAVWPQTEKVEKPPTPSETANVTTPRPDTSGAGRTNIASNHRKARVGNAGS